MSLLDSILIELRKGTVFPKWAKSDSKNLFLPSNRSLLDDDSVLWDMSKHGKCADHIEMSGFFASAIISYGKDNKGNIRLHRHLIIPNERVKPNVTQSSFSMDYSSSPFKILINGKKKDEKPFKSRIKGMLEITSSYGEAVIERAFYPSVHKPALIEKVVITNKDSKEITVDIAEKKIEKVVPESVGAFHSIKASSAITFDKKYSSKNSNCKKTIKLKANESISFYAVYYAVENGKSFSIKIKDEINSRLDFVDKMFSSIKLDSPSKKLNAQFAHCVLRGSESIFKTKNGLLHAPGGGNYYAALWTNDQCEYANPFFPFSGYQAGIEQSINCYKLYEKYMDKSDKPMAEKTALVTSIVACGDDYWNGAKDRGDGEMYAYGLSRFLLSMGDKKLMADFFENLVWCIDFALSRKNNSGVIASDSDELENRFESGNANLFTSCITYDALNNCAIIAEILGENNKAELWKNEAVQLKAAIEDYFGADVEGYHTYRYYEANTDLRAWICMPLTVGIFDRANDTVKALFSDKLYVNGMLKTTSANKTTWDRSLLFALRGTLLAGKTNEGIKALSNYCDNRLLGSHAPYPFEAFPEGNRAHLAAESILFARIVTEGLLGLRTVGYRKLHIEPRLNNELNYLNLSGISLYGLKFSIHCNLDCITIKIDDKEYKTLDNTAVFDFNEMKFE